MPLILKSNLKSKLEKVFSVPVNNSGISSQKLATALSTSFQDALSKLMISLTVSGVIPGSPPTPYPPTPEPPFSGIYNIGSFLSGLQSGFQSGMSKPNDFTSAASQKAQVIANQLDILFKTAIFNTVVHVGVVTIITPSYSLIKSSLQSLLASIYSVPTSDPSVKAMQIANAIESSTQIYISAVIFNMVASAAGGGSTPLSPGTGTGNFL